MKLVKHCLGLILVLFSAASVYSQTVDEIIDKHLAAIGGKDLLNTITSVKTESTVEVMGNDANSTTVVLNGKGFRSESEFNGQKVIQVYTDKGGWAVNPFQGASDPEAMPAEQFKAGEDNIYIEPFLNLADRGSKVELLGQEKIGDVNAYKIKLTNKDSASTTFYIDPNTYYTLQIVSTANAMGQQMDIRTTPSDYKKTDFGIVMPYSVEVNIGDQFTLTSKLQKVEINQPVDPSIFEMKK